MNRPLSERSLTDLASQLRGGELSSQALVQACLTRIGSFDQQLHAFITVAAEQALALAEEADRQLGTGNDLPPLTGLPIAVKDSIPTRGLRTTANSRLLEHWVPESDAAAIARLRAAGAIIIGKTNLNEFGWSLPADQDLVPPPRNPWNPEYQAIGSSSGSGVAAAAGFCTAAIGTDGGGSARLPAGQHGLVGIKATHGRVSRLGMDASSMSEISPLTRTVADAATLLTIMSGYEAGDPHGWPVPPPPFANQLDADVRGWRIGVPWSHIEAADLEPEVAAAFQAGLDEVRRLGAETVAVDLPDLADARAANFIVLNAEGYTEHATSLRRDGDRYGASARRYRWMGAFLSAADYLNAKRVGRQARAAVEGCFREVRALVTPTSPVVTAEAARRPGSHRKGHNATFTAPFNITGHPAISIPCGMSTSTGLPIGLQLVGALYDETSLFQLAHAYEQATPWRTMRPPL